MDNYVTGAAIKSLREAKRLTQEELAERIHVSAKAVSKWETGKGFPDISLLEPLAKALDVSVIELLSGEDIRNRNRAFNMLKSVFYVCPACGNVICATGEAVISCCGVTLPALEAEEAAWIQTKESAIEAAGAEWEGGSGEPLARNAAGIQYTRERCYYLISLVKGK